MKSLKEQPDHPVWVLEIGEGADVDCNARKQMAQIGTTSKLHQPKILVVSGVSRAAAASGRNFLLNFVDVLTSSEPDALSVLKSASVHLVFDANPTEADADCATSSDSTKTTAEDAVVEFVAREKFTMVLATEFQSIGLAGSALSGLKHLHDKQLAEAYLQKLQRLSSCSPSERQSSTLINRINEVSNGTVALRLGLSCCAGAEQVGAILSSHRAPLLQLLLSARQGIAGIVTSQYSQPLDALIKVTGTRRTMTFSADR